MDISNATGSIKNCPGGVMVICITGGSGFVGGALARRLAASGQALRLLDIAEPKSPEHAFHRCDITNPESLPGAVDGGNVIVHLAAEHRDDVHPESRYAAVNTAGSVAVAQAAEEAGIERIVFSSTVAVYGLSAPGADETAVPAPFNAYGRSKLAAEKALRDWQARAPDRRMLAIVRPCVVFGPGNRGNVHTLFAQIAAGRFIMVGPGQHRKSLAHVDNLAAFLARCCDLPAGVHLFNYADRPDLTVAELVGLARGRLLGRSGTGLRLPMAAALALGYGADSVARLAGRRLPVSAIRVRKFLAETTVDARRAHALDGFSAPLPLREALDATLAAEFGAADLHEFR